MTEQDFDSKEQFMKSVYRKVFDLRTILQETKPNFSQSRNMFFKSQDKKNFIEKVNGQKQKDLLKFIKPQTSVNFVEINDQSKINRQQIIVNQRIKNESSPERKLANTFSNFSNINTVKISRQTRNERSTVAKQSLNQFQFRSLRRFSLSHGNFGASTKKQLQLMNNFFCSKQLAKPTNITNEKNQRIQIQSARKNLTEGRNQNKMKRLLGFLGKNSQNHSKNDKIINQNEKMKEMKEMTKNRQKTRSQIKNSNKKDQIQSSRDEQQLQIELEENYEFKPIGSAKTQRRLVNLHQDKSLQNDSALISERIKNSRQKQILIVDSKVSNYSKNNSNEKKTYLQKGNRLREILYKKLSDQSAQKGKQMVYVREYDQWVPSEFVQNNKKQLQIYLQLLLGQKKQIKQKKMTLNQAQIIYY